MLPRIEPEERLQPSERLIVLGIGLLIFGGFAVDVFASFAWVKAGALIMFVAWVGLIGVHEVGHALVAAMLGWRVCRIVIGMGKPVLRFRVAGVPIQLCRYPVGGHVVPAPRDIAGARWKSSLIYAAGPGAEALVLLALVAGVGFSDLTGSPEGFAVLSAQAVAVAALLGVVFNLIPLTTREGAATDGLGILVSWWLPPESFTRRLALPYTTRAESLLLAGRRAEACEVLVAGALELKDTLPALLAVVEGLLDAAEPDKVIELLDPLVLRRDIPETLQPAILACLSTALLRAAPERIEDAGDYTQFALQAAPASQVVRLARARVLIELEQLHPAARLLDDVRAEMFDDRLTDTRDTLLARIEHRRGQRATALDLLKKLESRGARGPELDLLRREMGLVGEPS